MLAHIIGFINIAAIVAFLVATTAALVGLCLRRSRQNCSSILFLCALVWGLQLWIYCVATLWLYWGWGPVIFGLLFLGIGVLPVAVVKLLFSAHWLELTQILVQLAAIWGTRLLGAWFSHEKKREWARESERLRLEHNALLADTPED
jgi:hypothetical protein